MKPLLFFLSAASITALCSAGEILHVTIRYTEGRANPQGDYLLIPDNEGRYSLSPITREPGTPMAKREEISSSLLKLYPALLEGEVKISPIEEETKAMAAAGMVKILGQVKNKGNYAADTLGTCVSHAVTTVSGSVRRLQVVHNREIRFYNLDNPEHSQMKLEPGSIVLVPTKIFIGR